MRKLKASIYLTLIVALISYNYSTLAIRSPLSMSTRSPSTKRIGDIFQRLRADPKRVFILDGGTGEELIRRGVPDDRKIWSATALVRPEFHDTLKTVHKSFLAAGADAVTTNSYGVTPGVGFTLDEIAQYCATASRIARDAVTEHASAAKTKPTTLEVDGLVFGSLGPLIESYRADKIMEHDQGVEVYTRMAQAMAGSVDAFLAETLSSVEESMQAIHAIGDLPESLSRPVMISYSLDGNGDFRSGESVCEGIPRLLDFVEQHQVEVLAILFNCSEPEAINRALQTIQVDKSLRDSLHTRGILLGAYANRLTPVASDWSLTESNGPQPMRQDLDPQQYYNSFVATWVRDLGVQIVGGCCGITPEHIAHLSSQLRDHKQ